jgi:hypothetical protein
VPASSGVCALRAAERVFASRSSAASRTESGSSVTLGRSCTRSSGARDGSGSSSISRRASVPPVTVREVSMAEASDTAVTVCSAATPAGRSVKSRRRFRPATAATFARVSAAKPSRETRNV